MDKNCGFFTWALRFQNHLSYKITTLQIVKFTLFSGNERLQTLTLSHNKITSIAPYVFPLLKHLKTIDLSHNFIDEIHRNTFENLGNSVEALNIDNNRLGSLREEIFLPLTNLKSLQVNH